jgi:hypothetical protein
MSDPNEGDSTKLSNHETSKKEILRAINLWESIGIRLENLCHQSNMVEQATEELISEIETLMAVARRILILNNPEYLRMLQKENYRINELSKVLGVEPYVLRYWGAEFSGIKRAGALRGKTTYRKKHLVDFFTIKRLLYKEKFTVAGAKRCMREIQEWDQSKHATSSRPTER